MSTTDSPTARIPAEPETPARTPIASVEPTTQAAAPQAAPVATTTAPAAPTEVVDRPGFDDVVTDGTVVPDPAEQRAARAEAYSREKQEFGGFKFGSAFFGWLSASGLAIILTGIVAGTGVALGLGQQATDAVNGIADTGTTTAIGIGGLVAVVVILFVSYLAGGYVAGRMARFSGAKQGVAVWLWAILAAVVLAIVAAIAGQPVLANLNAFPRIPINEGTLTTTGIIVAVLAALVPLVGAVLGGLLGMRFHRKVDRVGFGA